MPGRRGAQVRVLTGGRPDLDDYRHQIIASTARDHGPELEAGLEIGCSLYRRRHDAYVDYLKGGGRPGGEARSSRYRVADAAYTGALNVLAVAFGVRYPKVDRQQPFTEVHALIEKRVGPMCTGWTNQAGDDTVHSDQACPLHTRAGR